MLPFCKNNMCKPKCRKPLFYAVFSVLNCRSCLSYPATCKNNMRQKPAFWGLASEVPVDFNGVIFCSFNSSSDYNMVDHNIDCFTI